MWAKDLSFKILHPTKKNHQINFIKVIVSLIGEILESVISKQALFIWLFNFVMQLYTT